MSWNKKGLLSLCAFGSALPAMCQGKTLGACRLKRLPRGIKELPVAEEGTKPGIAELQAFALEESKNFFLAFLSPSYAGVSLGMV